MTRPTKTLVDEAARRGVAIVTASRATLVASFDGVQVPQANSFNMTGMHLEKVCCFKFA